MRCVRVQSLELLMIMRSVQLAAQAELEVEAEEAITDSIAEIACLCSMDRVRKR